MERLSPFLLAFLLILMLVLVSLMIAVFPRSFLRVQVMRSPRLDPETGQQTSTSLSYGNTELWTRWIIGSWLNRTTGHHDLSNPQFRALTESSERGSAEESLQLPERAITRFRPGAYFYRTYSGLHHQFSVGNYPSTRIWSNGLLLQHRSTMNNSGA
ncbi:hypothetical protein ARMGADRAFT_1010637 [Armillaria gallica]|uniref:Uncharacterized protein n=1 Tax=Armillaria gallica TaxID=47427 RepID=A0A2H3DKF8_ARMGA|nr:hypothetical protein ARMGADRAFT_1010637 [Armillaria gallica]